MTVTTRQALASALVALAGAGASAQTAFDAFSVQGFLEENGVAADGQYDIEIDFYSTPGGATGLIAADLFFAPVEVRDGVFTIDVLPQFQIGAAAWQQIRSGNSVFAQFAFRRSGSGAAFTPMASRIPLGTSPRASYASDIPAALKPFVVNAGDVSLATGLRNVGLGTTQPREALDVRNGNIVTDDMFARKRVWFAEPNGSFDWRMSVNTARALVLGTSGSEIMTLSVNDGARFKTESFIIDGDLTTRAINLEGADIAESFDVNGEIAPMPGHVVVIDADNAGDLALSGEAYDTRVAGVISGAGGIKPGAYLSQPGTLADGEHPVAMSGRVYVYVDADANGAVQPGDMLTTSATPGHAMKATDRGAMHGAVIGKAMTGLESGRGLVLVLVNLQ